MLRRRYLGNLTRRGVHDLLCTIHPVRSQGFSITGLGANSSTVAVICTTRSRSVVTGFPCHLINPGLCFVDEHVSHQYTFFCCSRTAVIGCYIVDVCVWNSFRRLSCYAFFLHQAPESAMPSCRLWIFIFICSSRATLLVCSSDRYRWERYLKIASKEIKIAQFG